jgi:HAMP domain-containing protein
MLINLLGYALVIASVALAFVQRRWRRRAQTLATFTKALAQGDLSVSMSDLKEIEHGRLLKGEIVGRVGKDEIVFHAITNSVTGQLERVKLWIGQTRFIKEARGTKPIPHQFQVITNVLDKHLRDVGRQAILPESS